MQGVYGLQVDGIVGRQTWVALRSNGAESALVTSTEEASDTALVVSPAGTEATSDQDGSQDSPGPRFFWDNEKLVWYSYWDHYYYDVNPDDPIYNLWIRKENIDFHIKMEPEKEWNDVTQADIDSLQVMSEGKSRHNKLLLSKATLFEFTSVRARTNNHPENTPASEMGFGQPIETLIDREKEIDELIGQYKKDIREYANILSDESATTTGWWATITTNADEDRALGALREFDVKSDGLYTVAADLIRDYESFGGVKDYNETPSEMLADRLGHENVAAMVGKLDEFLYGDEYAEMYKIISRHDNKIVERAREVIIIPTEGIDTELSQAFHGDFAELQRETEWLAMVVGAESYNPNTGLAGNARRAVSALEIIALIGTGGFSAAVVGGLKGARAIPTAYRAARMGSRLGPLPPIDAAGRTVSGIRSIVGTGGALRTGVRAMHTATGNTTRWYQTTALATKLGIPALHQRKAAYAAIAGTGAANFVGDVTGLKVWGDGANEDEVVEQFRTWDHFSQAFYEDNSQFIVDNNLDVPTPTELLVKMYDNYVTKEDKASSKTELLVELDEFLEGQNLTTVTNQISRNDLPYSTNANRSISESFTVERFSKLAGLLKG
jgi:hypothetical protein